jgi:hypothetical protein
MYADVHRRSLPDARRAMIADNPIKPELIVAAIDAAEELRDPLDGLVEKTAKDPGAPFEPDVLERRARLKKDDRGAFEELFAKVGDGMRD